MMYLPEEGMKERIESINAALNERFERLSVLNEEILEKEKEIEKVSYEIKLLAEEGLWLTDDDSIKEV